VSEDNEELPENVDPTGLDQLYCFMDAERVCGPECMAFLTFPRKANSSELSEMQAHCTFLTSADRVGRNITILTSALINKTKADKLKDIDRARDQATPKVSPSTQLGPFAAPTSPFPVK